MEQKEKNLDRPHAALRIALDLWDILVSIFMLLIMAALPFYFTNGYAHIGSDKHDFLYTVCRIEGLWCLPVMAAVVLLWFYVVCVRDKKKIDWKKQVSVTDLCVLAYAIVTIMSYLLSDFKETMVNGEIIYGDALHGITGGWYMGLLTQLIFVAIYFSVSRGWFCRQWMVALFLPVTAVVYALGVLNRFGIFPISMENSANVQYISTIGNINWYCGYLVTVFFGAVYYWWAGQLSNRMRYLMDGYLFLGCLTLLTQGSSSGILVIFVLLVVFFVKSGGDGEKMQRFWQFLLIAASACLFTLILRAFFPGAITYHEAVTDLLTTGILPLVLFPLALIGYILVRKWQEQGRYPVAAFVLCGRVVCIMLLAVLVIYVQLLIFNTLLPGVLGPLSGMSIFRFDAAWGSNRGATWMAGISCFLGQDFAGKLLGVGPDCMALYIHGGYDPKLLAMVQETFTEELLLTNAHNEWITMLANGGLLGAAAYVGIIVSGIRRFWKWGRENVIIGACGMGVLAYTINNFFSFQQSMSTTTMFLILGIGEAYIRRIKNSSKENE